MVENRAKLVKRERLLLRRLAESLRRDSFERFSRKRTTPATQTPPAPDVKAA